MINLNLVIEIALAIIVSKLALDLLHVLFLGALHTVVKKKYVSNVKVAHMYKEEED